MDSISEIHQQVEPGFSMGVSTNQGPSGIDPVLGCSVDLVGLLSNRAYRVYYGLLWWLLGDTNWAY